MLVIKKIGETLHRKVNGFLKWYKINCIGDAAEIKELEEGLKKLEKNRNK